MASSANSYEKQAPAFTPSWVKTFPVPRRETRGNDINYILVTDLPTFVWLGNLANLEMHPFLHRVPRIDRPTSIVFDCDPDESANILSCARVALTVGGAQGTPECLTNCLLPEERSLFRMISLGRALNSSKHC